MFATPLRSTASGVFPPFHRGLGNAEVPVAITTASASPRGPCSESGSRESACAYSIWLSSSAKTSRSLTSLRPTARTLYLPSLARRALVCVWFAGKRGRG